MEQAAAEHGWTGKLEEVRAQCPLGPVFASRAQRPDSILDDLSHSTRTSLPGSAGSPPVRTQKHHALVELSTHVTDTADKLKHTLAHELCHLAAWALSGEMKPPHGVAFKLWCVC